MECVACRSHTADRLVDVMDYRPWGASNTIKLDAIREARKGRDDPESPRPRLLEFVRTPPMVGRNKVAIFWDAHRMNSDVANAILKTIEEPAPTHKFIFATHELTYIKSTVRSRCLNMACPDIENELDSKGLENFHRYAWDDGEKNSGDELRLELIELLNSSRNCPTGSALVWSQECRSIAEKLAKSTGSNAKTSQEAVLKAMTGWALDSFQGRPEIVQKIVETHRFVSGYGSAGVAFDTLWAEILELQSL